MSKVSRSTIQKADSEIEIRRGCAKDLMSIMQIMFHSFSPEFGESWNENQCRTMLALPRTHFLKAVCNGQICGFSISRSVADEEELLMIAVHPQYQNRGFGKKILKHLICDVEERNIVSLFLEVRSTNEAQTFYRKLGFRQIGTRHAYYTGQNRAKHDANTYKLTITQ